jgi:hypothetical protein
MATNDKSAQDSRTGVLTPQTLIGLGGLLMTASMFFRLAYGPYGASISYFSLLSWNLRWPPSPILLLAWPVAFGLLETVFALALLIHGGWARRWYHWFTVAVFLGTVAALHLGLLWWHAGLAGGFQRREALVSGASAVGALIGLILATILPRAHEGRSQAVRLVGAAWVLVVLHPVPEWTSLETVLVVCGPGYWMLLAGTLLIAVGSVRHLVSGEGPSRQAA